MVGPDFSRAVEATARRVAGDGTDPENWPATWQGMTGRRMWRLPCRWPISFPFSASLRACLPSTITVNVNLQCALVAALPADPGYDLEKDFAPIGLIASVPIVIMSNPSVPAKSLAEVIALAKKAGERLTVGTPPAPTLNYFGAEQFKAMTGTKITIVTYKGTAQSS